MEDSAAKKRAAARREAILNSKGNRLAKLTSSARGEEAAGLYDDPPLPSVRSSPIPSGDESSRMPRPSTSTPWSHIPSGPSQNEPIGANSPGSDERQQQQQQQMMEALMGNFAGGPMGSINSLTPGLTPPGINPSSGAPANDPFATMMAQLASGQPLGSGAGIMPPMPPGFNPAGMGMGQAIAVARKKGRLEKLLPLLHVVSILCLLAYFVIGYEPALFGEGHWARWATLVRAKNEGGVHPVPIFYAFTTLEIVLHSIRVYLEPPPQPRSGIIGMIIANLPPPFPGLIASTSKYLAMGGAVMDDVSVLLFGVGLVVWYAGWAIR
ncbi:hypothetical protein FRB96_003012 [Tulasnella sp. 330]|nr:hypothetical protein FRB96_003012 [Tulasnella sp. 330]KAG8883723.1 hypothetical protein FRB97_006034 [Tulasnella sp. 331]KAG8889042.1 hypothetical protein FRB98_005939 [Tulasnella sp. 332]